MSPAAAAAAAAVAAAKSSIGANYIVLVADHAAASRCGAPKPQQPVDHNASDRQM